MAKRAKPTLNGNGRSHSHDDNPWGGIIDPIAVNKMDRLLANLSSGRREWQNQFEDPRRSIADECGYPSDNTGTGIGSYNSEMFRDLYEKEPIATRVVQVLSKECWQVQPLVYETDDADTVTPFEQAWDDLGQSLRGHQSWYQDEKGSPVWEYLQRVDMLSGIGHFGILLLGVADGRNLDQPIDGASTHVMPDFKPKKYTEIKKLGTEDDGGEAPADEGDEQDKKPTVPGPLPKAPTANRRVRRVVHPSLAKPWPVVTKNWSVEDQEAEARWIVANAVPSKPGKVKAKRPTSSFAGAQGTDQQYDRQDQQGLGNGEPYTQQLNPLADARGTDAQYRGVTMNPPGKGNDPQYLGVQLSDPEYPADEPSTEPKQLLFLRAFDESLVQIVQYEADVRNPRFAQPVMYRVTLNDPREQHSGIGLPLATVRVHWSRVVHIADNLGSSEIFGVPRMRPVLRRLLDLQKLYGGSAEMYWRGAFFGLSLETHPQLGGDVELDESALQDMMENYGNGLQRYLALRGMHANPLAPTVVDPGSHIDKQIQAICIQIGIPQRVFMGSERGELASSQDDASWNDRLRARQNTYLTPRLITTFIDRLIAIGVLPEPEGYSVEWPDLDSATKSEKATVALTRTQAMAAYVSGGVEQLVPPLEYLTTVLEYSEEEAQAILESAVEHVDEKTQQQMDQQKDMIDQGLAPDPTKPPPQPPGQPQKLGAGQHLVHPDTGATIAKGPPVPKPAGAAK